MKIVSFLIGLFVFTDIIAQTPTSPITWISPEDGGTPRDLNRIKQVSPQEFHIQTVFQEGGTSILKHAI